MPDLPIDDATVIAALSAAGVSLSSELAAHEVDTTSIHGIADTAALGSGGVNPSYLDLSSSGGLLNVDVSLDRHVRIAVSEDVTWTPINLDADEEHVISIVFVQDGTGGHAVTHDVDETFGTVAVDGAPGASTVMTLRCSGTTSKLVGESDSQASESSFGNVQLASVAQTTAGVATDVVTTPAGVAAALAALKAQSWTLVAHGATAGTARPSGWAGVIWVGSVQPTNATGSDFVIRTDEAV